MEKLANLYSSTLSAGYTSGSGSMSVTSASGLPTLATGDTTHLAVRDASTKLVKLLVKVTAISGTTLTVTAESTDVNCSSGDLIDGSMLTAESVAQIQADVLSLFPTAYQWKSGRGNVLASLTLDFASMANHIVVIALGWESGSASNCTVSDSAGTTYTRAVQITGATENIAIFVGQLGASPGTLTITPGLPSGGAWNGISVIEFSSGVTTTVNTTASGSSHITITPSVANCTVVIASQGSSSGATQNIPPSYTGLTTNGSDSGGIAFSFTTPPSGVAAIATLFNSSPSVAYAAIALTHP